MLNDRLHASRIAHWAAMALLACLPLSHAHADQPALALDVQMQHPDNIDTDVGWPAIIEPRADFPSFELEVTGDAQLQTTLHKVHDDTVAQQLEPQQLTDGQNLTITFDDRPQTDTTYRVQFELATDNDQRFRDAYYFTVLHPRNQAPGRTALVRRMRDGSLAYTPDYRGNRIPDFSTTGYKDSDQPLPEPDDIPIQITLEPQPGDNTQHIQDAIDQLAEMPRDDNGFRGVIELGPGVFELDGQLNIQTSGIVIRGAAGPGSPARPMLQPRRRLSLERFRQTLENQPITVLLATSDDSGTLINVHGSDGVNRDSSSESNIIDNYVPVGAHAFHVQNPERFSVGDQIIITRRGNSDWISAIDMDQIPNRPDGGTTRQWDPFSLQFENQITHIDDSRITVKHPILNAIEQQWGGGHISTFTDHDRINNVAVENLRAVSFWIPDDDDLDQRNHRSAFISFANVRDAWVRDVTAEHFFGNTMQTSRSARNVNFKDIAVHFAPGDFYSGYVAKYAVTLHGQGSLVEGAYAEYARHAYALGARVAGPNVFLESVARNNEGASEPHHRWSVGGLYDNVEGSIALMNRLWMGSGHGWAGANYVAWNTRGSLVAQQPPTAQNWAIGHVGRRSEGHFADHAEPGYWESHDRHVPPRSLFRYQLQQRLQQNQP